jgi:hypothetical protein
MRCARRSRLGERTAASRVSDLLERTPSEARKTLPFVDLGGAPSPKEVGVTTPKLGNSGVSLRATNAVKP